MKLHKIVPKVSSFLAFATWDPSNQDYYSRKPFDLFFVATRISNKQTMRGWQKLKNDKNIDVIFPILRTILWEISTKSCCLKSTIEGLTLFLLLLIEIFFFLLLLPCLLRKISVVYFGKLKRVKGENASVLLCFWKSVFLLQSKLLRD